MKATETASYDVIIVGSGPAGMAAASTAAAHGARVVLLDEQRQAGGQIYRDVERVAPLRGDLLGADYLHGLTLTTGLSAPGIVHIRDAAVWMIEPEFRVTFSSGSKSATVEAKHLILASGALERPMPLPGWTLPGVIGAGAAQIMLKQSGVATRNAVLIGSGPLLYLVASQLTRAGAPPAALLETQQASDFKAALRHVAGALKGWRYLLKGATMLAQLRWRGIPRYVGVRHVRIEGSERAQAVVFSCKGHAQRIACDTILLHHGVVPNTQLARSLGVSHQWSAQGHCFVPKCDDWGETDLPGVFVTGDSAGIGGARVAEFNGQLAALRVAMRLGLVAGSAAQQAAATLRQKRDAELAVRPFLDAAYPPYTQALHPSDETVVCRCEEVTAGSVRGYAKLGCMGPNQTKAFGRCGMGPCQGRFCGLTVTQLLAQAHGLTPDAVGYQRIRAPLKPVTLAELASMHTTQQSLDGAKRHG